MQPIKTTNAINPAPAKGIESFPTPVIDDVVISEVVNSWKGDYQPLEYGVLWKDVSHAPNQGSFPEHKLVFQQPNSEDGQWVKRIWVNDRVNQDSYNYAIKYSAGSQEHPIYIRTYIVPRETYAPLLDGTPDPLFPGALLVDEEAQRTEGELDSKYITVTRVYETIPGPEVPTKRYNERGDLETVIVQTVPPFTPPDPDGLLVTGSQVVQEEMGKGVKTTSTVQDHSLLQIKENKGGLLGNTTTTDDIVSPTTTPDPLSISVLSSTVEQYTATKARKRTTTSSGPSLLEEDSMVDSPVGLVKAKVSKSIVAKGTQPSLPTSTADQALKIVTDTITPIDSAKAERDKVEVSNWPLNYGVDYDEQLGIGVYFSETVVKPETYLDAADWTQLQNKSYKPLDHWKSLERAIDRNRVGDALLSQWIKIPTTVDVNLPDKLLGVTVYWGKSYGAGGSFSNDFDTSTGSFSLSASGSSKNSYGINGDIYFNIQKGFSGALKAYKHIFFMETLDGRAKEESILDVINNFESYGERATPYTKNIQSVSADGVYIYVTTSSPHNISNIVNYCAGTATGDQGGNFSYSFSGQPIAVDSNTFKVSGFAGSFPSTPATGAVELYIRYGLPPYMQPSGIYQNWPYIQSRTENLVVITGGKSETFNSSKSAYASINGFGSGSGQGSSIDVDVNARSINIPETLHGKITIEEKSFGTTGPSTLEPTYGIRPTILETTKAVINGNLSAAATFPVGKYLFSSNIELYKWGFVKVEAITVEITQDLV